ncbi:protein 5NUC-like isoform X2 [Dermacentor albipictus]|uniref:protein 5NUC-like isoform X2 n=1 Tax=Dermacentor albipictus TaxID=60249 RepID=UPI0038FD3A16
MVSPQWRKRITYTSQSTVWYACCCVLFNIVSGEGNFSLVILHTNDVHARLTEVSPSGTQCTPELDQGKKCVGGLMRHYAYVTAVKSRKQNVLFLNPGDYFQGTTWFSSLPTKDFAAIVSYMKHDAIALGVHEFDRGTADLRTYLNAMENQGVPVVLCNVDVRREPRIESNATQPSRVLKFNNGTVSVGIIGYINPLTAFKSYPGHTQFTNDVECVRREAQRLKKQGVNIIIALGHSGLEYDKRIAFEVPLVDIVVGGNSHYFMFSGSPLVAPPEPVYGPYPVVIQRPDGTQAVVVTAFWFGKYVGQLEVHFDSNGYILGYEGFPVLMDSSIDVEADDRIYVSKLAESITTAREKADTDRNQPIGSTKVLLEGSRQRCRLEECSMGNLLTDALFNWYAGLLSEDDNLWGPVNGAILPGRDIFASIDERLTRGRILLQHVIEVLAFNDDVNHAFVVTMPGRILQELLEGSMKEYDVTKRAPVTDFLQVSGIRVEYNVRRRPYYRVTRLHTVCTDCRVPTYVGVEPNKTYRYVVPQTMFNGSETVIFEKLPKASILNTAIFLNLVYPPEHRKKLSGAIWKARWRHLLLQRIRAAKRGDRRCDCVGTGPPVHQPVIAYQDEDRRSHHHHERFGTSETCRTSAWVLSGGPAPTWASVCRWHALTGTSLES